MIEDKENTLGLIKFNVITVITTSNAGQIIYIVRNSNARVREDNWQLKIEMTSPPIFNPVAVIRNPISNEK